MISSSIGKVTTAHQKIRPIAAVPLTKRSNIAKSDSYPAILTVKGAKKTNASKNVVTVPTGVSDSLSKDSAQISDKMTGTYWHLPWNISRLRWKFVGQLCNFFRGYTGKTG